MALRKEGLSRWGGAAAGREKTGEGSEKTMPLLLWIFTKSKGKFCMRGKMSND